ncbi:GIY-YIG nuclease family protein [Streptomyces sp. NPDC087525]|uniref:GIY-YIG nuclease family protein n=1 Tax=Streptomyces sp. NPDC087525 TaxID=3365793 RepID=UPI00381CC653
MPTPQGRTAVYRLYDTVGALIYVGITNNPPRRWSLHAYEKTWWSDVTLREVEWHSTREEAEIVEAETISIFRPKWNTDGGEPPRGRPGSTSGKLRRGWEPDERIMQLVEQYDQEQRNLAQARDALEAEIVRVMRTGVSASRISKFLPFSTPMVQSIGKRAGVPLLRAATVEAIPRDATT